MITEVRKIRPDEPWMEEGNNVTLKKGDVFIRLLGGVQAVLSNPLYSQGHIG